MLLELLIAFSLLSIFAFPLVSISLKRFNSEVAALEKIERFRLAELALCEVKEKLYQNEIVWKSIPQKKRLKATRTLKKKEFKLGSLGKKVWDIHVFLYWDSPPKKTETGTLFGLLRCDLFLTPAGKKIVAKDPDYVQKIFVYSSTPLEIL